MYFLWEIKKLPSYFCKLPQPATSPVTVIHQFLDSRAKIPARIIYSLLRVQSLSSFSVTRYKYPAWIHLSSRSTSLVQRHRKDRRAPWLPVDSKYRTASAGAGSWPPEVKSEVTSVTFQRTPISTMLDLYRINVCQFSKVGLSTPTELRVPEVPAGHSWALLQRLFSFPNMITLGGRMPELQPLLSHSVTYLRGYPFPKSWLLEATTAPNGSLHVSSNWGRRTITFSKHSLRQSAIKSHECRASEGLAVKAPTWNNKCQ